jgi:hypothetical protein
MSCRFRIIHYQGKLAPEKSRSIVFPSRGDQGGQVTASSVFQALRYLLNDVITSGLATARSELESLSATLSFQPLRGSETSEDPIFDQRFAARGIALGDFVAQSMCWYRQTTARLSC